MGIGGATRRILPFRANARVVTDKSTHAKLLGVERFVRDLGATELHLIIAVTSPRLHILQQWVNTRTGLLVRECR